MTEGMVTAAATFSTVMKCAIIVFVSVFVFSCLYGLASLRILKIARSAREENDRLRAENEQLRAVLKEKENS